jgi:hypothetical protein
VVGSAAVGAAAGVVGPADETADPTALVVPLDRSTADGPVQAASIMVAAMSAPRADNLPRVPAFTAVAYAGLPPASAISVIPELNSPVSVLGCRM